MDIVRIKIEKNTQAAVHFLKMVVVGDIDEAYEKYVDPQGVHHNAHFAAGFENLKKGMKENHQQFPHKTFEIKQLFVDNDTIATFSKIVLDPAKPAIAVVHIFRFENDKIVEMWDVGQELPKDFINKDGPF